MLANSALDVLRFVLRFLGFFQLTAGGRRLTVQRFAFLIELGLGFLFQFLQLCEFFRLFGVLRLELGLLGIQARFVLRLERFHPLLFFLAFRLGLGFRRAARLLQLDPLALRFLQGRIRLGGLLFQFRPRPGGLFFQCLVLGMQILGRGSFLRVGLGFQPHGLFHLGVGLGDVFGELRRAHVGGHFLFRLPLWLRLRFGRFCFSGGRRLFRNAFGLGRGLLGGSQPMADDQAAFQMTNVETTLGQQECASRAAGAGIAVANINSIGFEILDLAAQLIEGYVDAGVDTVFGMLVGEAQIQPARPLGDERFRLVVVNRIQTRLFNELDEIILGQTHQLTVGDHGHGGIALGVGDQGLFTEAVAAAQLRELDGRTAARRLARDLAAPGLNDVVVVPRPTLLHDDSTGL